MEKNYKVNIPGRKMRLDVHDLFVRKYEDFSTRRRSESPMVEMPTHV